MIRGPLAVVLALLGAIPSRSIADDPTGGVIECVIPTPAPKTSARLRWRSPDGGEGATGTWVSEPAMKRAAQRMDRCTTGWSTCEVNLSIEKGKHTKLSWKAWAIGIGGALALGFVAGATVAK